MNLAKIIGSVFTFVVCLNTFAVEVSNSEKIRIECEFSLSLSAVSSQDMEVISNFVRDYLADSKAAESFELPREITKSGRVTFESLVEHLLFLEIIVISNPGNLRYQSIRLRAVELQKIYLQVWFVTNKALRRLEASTLAHFEANLSGVLKTFDKKAAQIRAEYAPAALANSVEVKKPIVKKLDAELIKKYIQALRSSEVKLSNLHNEFLIRTEAIKDELALISSYLEVYKDGAIIAVPILLELRYKLAEFSKSNKLEKIKFNEIDLMIHQLIKTYALSPMNGTI